MCPLTDPSNFHKINKTTFCLFIFTRVTGWGQSKFQPKQKKVTYDYLIIYVWSSSNVLIMISLRTNKNICPFYIIYTWSHMVKWLHTYHILMMSQNKVYVRASTQNDLAPDAIVVVLPFWLSCALDSLSEWTTTLAAALKHGRASCQLWRVCWHQPFHLGCEQLMNMWVEAKLTQAGYTTLVSTPSFEVNRHRDEKKTLVSADNHYQPNRQLQQTSICHKTIR